MKTAKELMVLFVERGFEEFAAAIEQRDAEWEDRSVALVMGEVQDERDALREALRVAREALECGARVVGSKWCGVCSHDVEVCDKEYGVNCIGGVNRRALARLDALSKGSVTP